jgi:hypothetical protein
VFLSRIWSLERGRRRRKRTVLYASSGGYPHPRLENSRLWNTRPRWLSIRFSICYKQIILTFHEVYLVLLKCHIKHVKIITSLLWKIRYHAQQCTPSLSISLVTIVTSPSYPLLDFPRALNAKSFDLCVKSIFQCYFNFNVLGFYVDIDLRRHKIWYLVRRGSQGQSSTSDLEWPCIIPGHSMLILRHLNKNFQSILIFPCQNNSTNAPHSFFIPHQHCKIVKINRPLNNELKIGGGL